MVVDKGGERRATFSAPYKRYVLGALTAVSLLGFLDRGLMILLLQPIEDDLHLSDSQLGFLTGIAFGLFYATLGVPVARWADRGDRANITAIAVALWGVTVVMCVFVTNFFQLLLARFAAAVGEAGCVPATYSLVGDYYPEEKERSHAMSIYMLSTPLSSLLSFVLGGWLNERLGWRATFLVMGIPALLVAVIIKLTVREPRQLLPAPVATEQNLPGMSVVLGTLWRQRTLRHLTLGMIALYTMGFGLGPWYAAFMMRSHGMGTAELGVWMGLIFGGGGAAGILLGGLTASRWFAHDERGTLRLSAVTIAALVPCFFMFLLLPGKYEALLALIPLNVAFAFFLGPTFALLQRLVTDGMRATTMAVVMLLANLIGMGVGPQILGMLSDWLRPTLGNESLRYAMLAMSLISFWSAYHFWLAGRTVSADLLAVGAHPGTGVLGSRMQGEPVGVDSGF